MKISRQDATRKDQDGLSLWVYSAREQFDRMSAAYLEVTASHGLTMSKVNDRIYYITEGAGEFIMGAQTVQVEAGDVMIIPKGVEYDFWAASGKTLKLFLVHSPAYQPDEEVRPDR